MSNNSEQNMPSTVEQTRNDLIQARRLSSQSDAQDARVPVDQAEIEHLKARTQKPNNLREVFTQLAQGLSD